MHEIAQKSFGSCLFWWWWFEALFTPPLGQAKCPQKHTLTSSPRTKEITIKNPKRSKINEAAVPDCSHCARNTHCYRGQVLAVFLPGPIALPNQLLISKNNGGGTKQPTTFCPSHPSIGEIERIAPPARSTLMHTCRTPPSRLHCARGWTECYGHKSPQMTSRSQQEHKRSRSSR